MNSQCVSSLSFGVFGYNCDNCLIEVTDRIWLSSCYVNCELSKPLVVCIGKLNVEVQCKKVGSSHSAGVPCSSENLHAGANSEYASSTAKVDTTLQVNLEQKLSNSNNADHLQKKSLRRYKRFFLIVLKFAKILGVRFEKSSIVLVGATTDNISCHISIEKLFSDINGFSSQSLKGIIELNSLQVKLIKSISGKHDDDDVTVKEDEDEERCCLVSATIDQTISFNVSPFTCSKSQEINVCLHRCHATCALEFFDFLELQSANKPTPGRRKADNDISFLERASRFSSLNISVKIENIELVIEKQPTRGDVIVSLQTVQFSLSNRASIEHSASREGSAKLVLSGLEINTARGSLSSFTQFQISTEVDDNLLTTDLQFSGFFLDFYCQDAQHWFSVLNWLQHIFKKKSRRLEESTHVRPPTATNASSQSFSVPGKMKQTSIVGALVGSRTIKITADLTMLSSKVCSHGTLGVELGLSHLALTGTILKPVGSVHGPLELMSRGDIQLDVEVKTIYCKSLAGNLPKIEMNDKQHHWGVFFYAGILIVRCCTLAVEFREDKQKNRFGPDPLIVYKDLQGCKVSKKLSCDVIVDSVQLEISSSFYEIVDAMAREIVTSFRNNAIVLKPKAQTAGAQINISQINENTESKKRDQYLLAFNLQCTNCNVYASMQNTATSMLRCDTVSVQYTTTESLLTMNGVKLTYFLLQSLQPHPILRSVELQESMLTVRMLSIEHRKKALLKELVVHIQGEVTAVWSMAVHMCLQQTVTDAQHLATKYYTELHTGDDVSKGKGQEKHVKTSILLFDITGGAMIKLAISKRHSVSLMCPDVILEKSGECASFKCSNLTIFCDQHAIFKIKNIVFQSQHHSSKFTAERASLGTLVSPSNRAFAVEFDEIVIVFPYDYNFAECLEDVKAINKWRKVVYQKVKKPFTVDSLLPPDLRITAKLVTLQLSDDPFEVKLADIYELLCDENRESEKRLSAMDKRIQELRKVHGILPPARIEGLYASLAQKTSEIYIQRARQLYEVSPMRTALFTWSLNKLEILALADQSYHGTENVLLHMRDIDAASPIPDHIQFQSLFCRTIDASASCWTFHMRDFPQPMLSVCDLHVWGRLIGSEQVGIARAKRTSSIDMGEPWGELTVERNMPSMKFYHDFSADMKSFDMAYGPCWEPSMAQFNLTMNRINRPSIDPSRSMPFWDKFRLMLHGRLTMSIERSTWLYHASLDPYNTTEFMDWTWQNLVIDWTNAKWVLHGNLDIYSKTASKYDDCRVIHLPGLRLYIRLQWLCVGNPDDHHSVMPCAPDKVPEYPAGQVHDSYAQFRSRGFNVNLSLETGPCDAVENEVPSCLLYASTLRWVERLKTVMGRVSRPTRRGRLFNHVVPRKQQLMKSIRNLKVVVSVPKFQFCYWVSFSKQNGVELQSDALKLDVDLVSGISPPRGDGLIRRAATIWHIRQFDSQLNDALAWLCSLSERKRDKLSTLGSRHLQKDFLFSVEKVTYKRQEEQVPEENTLDTPVYGTDDLSDYDESPVHRLIVTNLKGSWTPSNRTVALSLYDGYSKAQTLKNNLSSAALKGFKVQESSQSPLKTRRSSIHGVVNITNSTGSMQLGSAQSTQSGATLSLLEKLVSESDSKFVAVHEEMSGGGVVPIEQLYGMTACQSADVLRKKWHIELYESQVMLQGIETSGYLIVSAAKTSLLACDHTPVWKNNQQLSSKSTLTASVECMQYYATVDAAPSGPVRWLTREHIKDLSATTELKEHNSDPGLVGLADMAGCGQSVGGVVSDFISSAKKGYSSSSTASGTPLQRIISRCHCQLFCAWYGDIGNETIPLVPALPSDDDKDVVNRKDEVDAFTLLHHDLKICTNSLQYLTILDIVNNLLLYVEPKKKELTEKLQNMRFKLQLASEEDQRIPIQQRQEYLRLLVAKVRKVEREMYLTHRETDDDISTEERRQELSRNIEETKEQVNALSEELAIMISCFRERQLQMTSRFKEIARAAQRDEAPIVRRNEVCFRQAEWRMTDRDGQIGIADLLLENFLYTKINRENDSGSHHLELGWFKVTNLLPTNPFPTQDVLAPESRPGKGFSDRMTALRVMCKFKAPVGGISVREHFEVNVVPLTIQMTAHFYSIIHNFFFPNNRDESDDSVVNASDESTAEVEEEDENYDDDDTASVDSFESSTASTVSSSSAVSSNVSHKTTLKEKLKEKKEGVRGLRARRKGSNASSSINDIDKMKERAARNNMFVYIKIPEVPLRVSYKSEKEKHILNINDFHFRLRTLEYHNQTWTWHDLAMALKSDCKKVIISQAVQLKLHIKPRSLIPDSFLTRGKGEADKALLLMGPSHKAKETKEKSVGKKSSFLEKSSK